MEIKVYHDLPEEAVRIRENVFVQEQGFREEFDKEDHYAVHLVLFVEDVPAATCRFFRADSEEEYTVGRIAVLKSFRGQKLGFCILARAEQEIARLGGRVVKLHAQQRAMPFYEKSGYSAFGEVELEEGCPHVWMMKKILSEET